jgi:hypothetical protein
LEFENFKTKEKIKEITNKNMTEKTTEKQCRIKYFPVSIFSIVFGLLGMTIVFEKLERI